MQNIMAIQIMRDISGTMGIILTVPITSLINQKHVTTRYITPSPQLENMPYSITGPAILNI